MLTLGGGQVECLWDEVLPFEARELPEDLARLDRVLRDPVLLRPVEQAWECSARERGRPSISIATFVRLMVVKQRTGWGYETLMREASDSLHLRRFCLIAIDQRVPEESTVRKLARRLGAEVVQEITRVVIAKAQRETRFGVVWRGSTRRSWRRTSAIPQTRCSLCKAPGRWPARARSSRG
jgi:IS5 family transposase